MTSESHLFSFTFTDPFTFALQLQPTSGVPLWWDLRYSVSWDNMPRADRFLEDVDLIIVPTLPDSDDGCCKLTVRRMLEVYESYLRENFEVAAHSEHWMVYTAR